MDFIYKIEDRLLTELEEIEAKSQSGEPMTHECLDDIKDISEALSNFSTYIAMKEGGGFSQGGYSQGGYSQDGYSQAGYSNARGGGQSRNAGRSRGRYSRNSYGRMSEDWGREPYMY